ncbi:MAG: Holliday junction branch migration protein RuvA [Firmicutes bacterium]|nr:Holliday junction branch migration protein RuvA [Bacillota bacterium]
MYNYIKGKIEEIGDEYIVVDNNGIGYKIMSSKHSIESIKDVTENKKIYTYLNVREDDLSLYGFLTKDELSIFKLLLTVSKIGPKVALAIVSTMVPNDIRYAINNEDINLLSTAPGVGKKTAKRMILELKDKIEDNNFTENNVLNKNKGPDYDEALSALLALGYTKVEVKEVFSKIDTKNLQTEDIIKKALKVIAK